MDNTNTNNPNLHSGKKKKNKYAELLNRYFKLISIFLFVLVIVAGYYLVIMPKIELKSQKNEQYRELSNEVASLQASSDLLSKYSDQIIDFTPEEERALSSAIPDKFDLPSIVVQLTSLASNNDFIVEDIIAEPVEVSGLKDKNIKRVDIEMSVSGIDGNDYGKFYKFVQALEDSIMIFDVKAISFIPEEIGYKLELSTYYYPKSK